MEENERLASLEHRLDSLSKRVDDLAERAGQRIDPVNTRRPPQSNIRVFTGLMLTIFGGVWLANQMGWLYFEIPIAATMLIGIGLYMIVTSRR